jgi:hypothetical protein
VDLSGHPDRFDIDGYLSRARRILWSVQQVHFENQIAPRDRVFLWRAAGRKDGVSGVIASGWITDKPRVQADDPGAHDLWRRPQPDEAVRVRLEVDRVANAKEIVQSSWLRDDPLLRQLRILRMKNETNYLLKAEEAERLSALWETQVATGTAPSLLPGFGPTTGLTGSLFHVRKTLRSRL